MESFETRREEETIALGETFASRLNRGDVVALYGDLGTGKTRFIKGICKGFGIHEHVASPTFTIIHEYSGGSLKIYHFDFYRMKSPTELRDIGFEEYIYGDGICLIEWADKIQEMLPPQRYDVHFSFGDNDLTRMIAIEERTGVAA